MPRNVLMMKSSAKKDATRKQVPRMKEVSIGDEPMNLIKYIPLPAEDVEFSRKQVRLMPPFITQFKGDLSDLDIGIYAACWALDLFEYQIKTRGPIKYRTCEECEGIVETLAKDRVNITFMSRCITCHDLREVKALAVALAREAVAASGLFD